MKAFTLIEILVVLGLIALGWLWLPSLITPTAALPQSRLEDTLALMVNRARMEALSRQIPVAVAVKVGAETLAVGYLDGSGGVNAGNGGTSAGSGTAGNFKIITQVSLPKEVAFDAQNSSVAGNEGVFDLVNVESGNSSDSGFWRVWWFDKDAKPVKTGGTLAFKVGASEMIWRLSDEGALMEEK